jgi:thiamine-phosphate pyrophosphorylase
MAGKAALLRVVDANANRAREGLRVIEDTARFVYHDKKAAAALRGLRHRLDLALRKHYAELLGARDVGRDPGKANPSEGYTEGLPAVLAANFKRVEESVRVLEEYGRVLEPESRALFQGIRFHVYGLEKMMLRRARM